MRSATGRSRGGFLRIDLSREAVRERRTLLQLRYPREEKDLSKAVFDGVSAELRTYGLMTPERRIADATIPAATPSVNSEGKARDPEMEQTEKGKK